ncbi:Uncharacterised protein [Staphylococcus xylosus]|nr:Uncharacterised protein [Staphylococcus xylosus]
MKVVNTRFLIIDTPLKTTVKFMELNLNVDKFDLY